MLLTVRNLHMKIRIRKVHWISIWEIRITEVYCLHKSMLRVRMLFSIIVLSVIIFILKVLMVLPGLPESIKYICAIITVKVI